MKPQTKVLDLQKLLAVKTAEQKEVATRQHAQRALDVVITGAVAPALIDPCTLSAARRGKVDADKARDTFASLPRPRRELAQTVHKTALEIAITAAKKMGGDYSGETSHVARFAPPSNPTASASTYTESGEAYGGRCKYSKTDALHSVWLDPSRVHALVESVRLRELSSRDGLPLIALDADGACVWVKSTGKQITEQAGWIIGDDECCYHSIKSREDAVKGHAKKRAKLDAVKLEQAERERAYKASPAFKNERRARLIARLCKEAHATIEDARALGYCTPGIEAFQRQHGIGNEASLPQLVRTGNPSAVVLAMKTARKICQSSLTPSNV